MRRYGPIRAGSSTISWSTSRKLADLTALHPVFRTITTACGLRPLRTARSSSRSKGELQSRVEAEAVDFAQTFRLVPEGGTYWIGQDTFLLA